MGSRRRHWDAVPGLRRSRLEGRGLSQGHLSSLWHVEWLRRLTGWWPAAQADGNRGHRRVNPDPRTLRRTGT